MPVRRDAHRGDKNAGPTPPKVSHAPVPLERVHRALLQKGHGRGHRRGGVLERLVAGLVVIGALLWGASILATPSDEAPPVREDEPATLAPDPVERSVDVPEPPHVEEEDDDEDEEGSRVERKGKGKRGDD